MSWELLDGPSRRPRVSWAVPEHLRDNARYGPFRRPAVPAPLDPNTLLQYIDNAISVTENAQTTRHLSLLFASSPSSSSSLSTSTSLLTSSSSSPLPPSSSSVSHLHDGGPSMVLQVPSAHKISRFKSLPVQRKDYINSLHNDPVEAVPASRLNLPAVSKIMNAQPLNDQESIKIDRLASKLPGRTQSPKFSEVESVSKGDQMSDKGEECDARAADDAYRAACCALSEGNAEHALSLLHVAAAKCPPDKQSALGKVQRLMAAAMQLVEKNSAVLRSLPLDKDAQ